MQSLFAILIIVQFLVIVSHDLLHIPGLTHGRQVRAVIGTRMLWIATAISAIFPATAVALAMWFWNHPAPPLAAGYWVIYCAVTVLSAIVMWYVPYVFGASEKKTRQYGEMYAGTIQVLPPRGDNPRPNLLHVCFHVLFVANLCLAVALLCAT